MDKTNTITIIDIAYFFLVQSDKPLYYGKVEKLCYYSYAWFLALKDDELIQNCKFIASIHGPTNKTLKSHFKSYRWDKLIISNYLTKK